MKIAISNSKVKKEKSEGIAIDCRKLLCLSRRSYSASKLTTSVILMLDKESNIYFGWNFMAIKDDIDCYPHPSKGATTWMHEICTVKKDAVSISRLRNCGVIFIGKANLHGLGMGTTGNNPNYMMASKHTTSVILMLDKVKKYK
ncbi:fatty acid amide hydrolase [Senna tora]|uniref:Fatty acid amide hydrolase n=1 Tax=Senna tora TaxID=362788 RepID=A0A834X013_9FABA|nr:fatty acid amide hydrolase [Senna tora]